MSLKQEYIKEELADEENITVEFTIQSKEDPSITIRGCYEVTDEEPELQYYNLHTNQLGWYVSNPFDRDFQEEDWEKYEHISSEFQSDDLFIQTLVDFEQENKTVDMGEYLLLINNGAELEIEIKELANSYEDYIVELIPKYNNEPIDLYSYFEENNITFDPYMADGEFKLENGHIYFEISKDYFYGDDTDKESNIDIINQEVEFYYKRMITDVKIKKEEEEDY